jgi:hypothetical protein
VSRGRILVVGALVISLALVGVYLAAGGASYTPEKSLNPCEPRPWTETNRGLEGLAEEFSLSALDGAACELGVSRERLARALTTKQAREKFAKELHIGDAKLAKAIRAGLVRAVDDAEEHGQLPSLIAGPLRGTFEHIPLDEAIEPTQDAKRIFSGAEGLFGPIGGLLEEFLP